MTATRWTHLTLLGLLVAGSIMFFVLAAGPPDANAAAGCARERAFTVAGGGAKATGNVREWCNDNQTHITGYLADTGCDGRSAVVRVEFFYGPRQNGSYKTYARGGCGTGVGYDHWAPKVSGGYMFSYGRVCVWSTSTWSWTSETCSIVLPKP